MSGDNLEDAPWVRSTKTPPATSDRNPWAEIGGLLAANVVLVAVLVGMLWVGGCFDSRPAAEPNRELVERMNELRRKQEDPRVSDCFQAAYALGQKFRREGIQKPGDVELHALGLKACDTFGVPPDMRGVAVEKFKSGFGWGWSSTR